MGLLSWWRGDGKGTQSESKSQNGSVQPKADYPEVAGMNGAVAVPGAGSELTIFEFGSVGDANSKFTMSGYCPVSDALEPCVWQLDPATKPKDPLFRVVF